MNKSIEVSGKNEEEAIAAALAQLGVDRDEVSIEVLERSKSGFLGIGAVPAKIRVTCSYEPSIREKTESFLTGLFEHMDASAELDITEDEDEGLKVRLVGSNLGALIGRRGETLDAIQHLTNYSVNRGEQKRVRISIDAENYRSKREEALKRLAEKVAGKAIKYRRDMALEPMNSYERHVIHSALQEYAGVTTYSTGVEPNRRVIVSYCRPGRPGQEQYRRP